MNNNAPNNPIKNSQIILNVSPLQDELRGTPLPCSKPLAAIGPRARDTVRAGCGGPGGDGGGRDLPGGRTYPPSLLPHWSSFEGFNELPRDRGLGSGVVVGQSTLPGPCFSPVKEGPRGGAAGGGGRGHRRVGRPNRTPPGVTPPCIVVFIWSLVEENVIGYVFLFHLFISSFGFFPPISNWIINGINVIQVCYVHQVRGSPGPKAAMPCSGRLQLLAAFLFNWDVLDWYGFLHDEKVTKKPHMCVCVFRRTAPPLSCANGV